LSTLQTS